MSDYLDPANEELLKDFFVEAEMQVETLESNILVLENDPSNADAIDELFRAAHTLKGGAGTVQMDELAGFTHLVEDALDVIRDGKVRIEEATVDTLLTATDVIKAMLEERRKGNVYEEEITRIEDALRAVLSAQEPAGVPEKDETPQSTEQTTEQTTEQPAKKSDVANRFGSPSMLSEYELLELQEAIEAGEQLYAVRITFREDNPMNTIGGIHLFTVLKSFSTVLKTDPDFDALYEDKFHPIVTYYIALGDDPNSYRNKLEISDVTSDVEILPLGGASTDRARTSFAAETPSIDETAQDITEQTLTAPTEESVSEDPVATVQKKARQSGSVLRVDSRRIDNLLNLVSETVINKAAFNQISADFTENLGEFQAAETNYRDLLKELFDRLPDYLEQIQNGKAVKEVRSEISERFSMLPDLFGDFESNNKDAVARFKNTAQNLGRIAGELQEGVMRIRMVPISQIFSRFPRLVRDLSRSLQKKIELVIEGEETELDKSVIEDLLDPLIHCVRNSIDHGIEDSAARQEAGKEEKGTVTLRASNEGNMILIEVIDDGRGIDVDAIRKKAIDRKIIHPNKQLTDIEAFNLIFDPGFSTAKSVTNVSGRGVGLDVVKRQIEKLNGTVTVWSEKGAGSRFTIKIPLTLAIIQGLLVKVGSEMYAIPITSVIDSHRIKPSEIKLIDNYEVFNVRDDVVSLIRLSRLFRIPTAENPEYHYVVIVGTNERKMGLIVDSLIGEEDVVIKPLRDHFTNSPGIAGANITGDGRVSLIIDVSQLLELGLRREKEERERRELQIGS